MTDLSEKGDQAEIARLRERVDALEQALSGSQAREQALRDGLTRLQFVVEGSNDGAWDWNLATGEAYLAPRWYEIFGYAPGELPGHVDSWLLLMHPEDVQRVNESLNAYLGGRVPTYEIEYRMRRKSGEWAWILSRGKVVAWDEEGRALRMTGTLTDVTRRREAEEALHRNQALLWAVVEHLPVIIYIRDREGRFLLVNKHHAAGLKLEPEQVIGRHERELYPPEVVQAFHAVDQEVLDTGRTVEIEESVPLEDGVHTYVSMKFPLVDEEGRIFAIGGISTDITERKRIAEERLALQAQTIEAQQIALRQISTPLIPIADNVLVMPLIGAIDAERAQELLQVLLGGVGAKRAETVIVDVTGVEVADTQVADALVRAAQAVRLLGARVVITGIRPEVAQAIVQTGGDLGSIETHGTLQSGIREALKRNRAARRGSRRIGAGPEESREIATSLPGRRRAPALDGF